MNNNPYQYFGGATQPPYQNFPTNSNQNGNTIGSIQPQYAENLLEKNLGKYATFYMSYSDSLEWRDRIFTGILEDAGRDYALLHNTDTGKWTILWTVYLDFVEFSEPINH